MVYTDFTAFDRRSAPWLADPARPALQLQELEAGRDRGQSRGPAAATDIDVWSVPGSGIFEETRVQLTGTRIKDGLGAD
jgi:hypothetical protein